MAENLRERAIELRGFIKGCIDTSAIEMRNYTSRVLQFIDDFLAESDSGIEERLKSVEDACNLIFMLGDEGEMVIRNAKTKEEVAEWGPLAKPEPARHQPKAESQPEAEKPAESARVMVTEKAADREPKPPLQTIASGDIPAGTASSDEALSVTVEKADAAKAEGSLTDDRVNEVRMLSADMTDDEMAEYFGVSRHTVLRFREKHGIRKDKGPREGHTRHEYEWEPWQKQKLMEMKEANASYAEIGKVIGKTASQCSGMYYWEKKKLERPASAKRPNGEWTPERRAAKAEIFKETRQTPEPKIKDSELEAVKAKLGKMSLEAIGREHGCSGQTVVNFLARHGIDARKKAREADSSSANEPSEPCGADKLADFFASRDKTPAELPEEAEDDESQTVEEDNDEAEEPEVEELKAAVSAPPVTKPANGKPYVPVSPDGLIQKHNGWAGKRDPGQELTDEDWPDIRDMLDKKRMSIGQVSSHYDVGWHQMKDFVDDQREKDGRKGSLPPGEARAPL